MEQRHEYKYVLSNGFFVFVCVYYIILLVLGMFGTGKVLLLDDSNNGVMPNTLCGSLSAAVMCSSLEYLRRLYKAKINNNVQYNKTDCTDKSKSIGYTMYFF